MDCFLYARKMKSCGMNRRTPYGGVGPSGLPNCPSHTVPSHTVCEEDGGSTLLEIVLSFTLDLNKITFCELGVGTHMD
jgi:hypothetical protein